MPLSPGCVADLNAEPWPGGHLDYRQVIDAYMEDMRAARVNGHDLARVQSVASSFVSRMDTEVDRRLEAVGSREALASRGTAAIANASYTFSVYTEAFTGPAGCQAARTPGQGRTMPRTSGPTGSGPWRT
jgi:transaldolase